MSELLHHFPKGPVVRQALEVDEEIDALDGYVLDAKLYNDGAAGLKKTSDNAIVLIPQPSQSPDDPLNWNARRKQYIVAVVAFLAFLPDYTAGTSIIPVIPQSL